MNIEEIRQELDVVVLHAPHGAQAEVAEIIGYSREYLWRIIKGKDKKADTAENRELIKTIISEYRKINRRALEELQRGV